MAELEELEQEEFDENILEIPNADELPDVPTNQPVAPVAAKGKNIFNYSRKSLFWKNIELDVLVIKHSNGFFDNLYDSHSTHEFCFTFAKLTSGLVCCSIFKTTIIN